MSGWLRSSATKVYDTKKRLTFASTVYERSQLKTGYAYDPSGNCGKDCKVCKYWNDKMKKDSVACWKEIEERKVSEHWQ